jgi:cytochrome c oxidase subunit 3
VLFQWFSQAIGESEGGLYSDRIDVSFRWSMSWFIFSEVMFFAAFFGALYWARVHSVPMLGNLEHQLLWPDFKALWPSAGPGITASPAGTVEPFSHDRPVAAADHQHRAAADIGRHADHRAPRADRRPARQDDHLDVDHGAAGRHLPVCAGLRVHARLPDLNLKLSSGIFGSTFFMLTGFHGFHVFVGMLMLLFITLRLMKGHFTPERHFGFEGAAWYWHFVDVVWLGLYILVYWL